nr:BTAD domain-containing putative transcriptional regulator [Mycobacterium shigaense]
MSTLPCVELGVLGPLQVRQDGVPVAIPGAKPRAILTMLGLHSGSVVSAVTLIELLWDRDPPRTADKALQTHISALRRTLGDGLVLTEGMGWTLAGTEVDASRYTLAARLGRHAAAAGDIGQAVARLEEAMTLWRGTPELPDGQRGVSEKTRWIERHAALVEDRADALLATRRAAEIIGELEAAVAEAPLRERRWGQLMLALYRAGRQGDALGAYQRARSLLADELGIDPGPELRRLETAIVAQDPSLDTPVAQHLPSVTRAVTFLLTDIEGSTAAWEADAAAMGVALARHDELVEQVVTSRGGKLIKTRGEGDATFSVFDRPSAAAAAAFELQDAIGHEPWELREPMRVRVALHTGEVELRDGDYFGRAVNRAARLRSLADGGQILCSGATAELVIDSLPDDVLLTDLGMRKLKNLPRPEHVFELRLEASDDGPDDPEATEPPMERPALPAVLIGAGPFVGRGSELEQLLLAWQTTLTGGAHTVLIAGEPGVGKTRLAGEWSQRAYGQGAVVLYGRCDEDLGAPYQPFAEALRSLVPCVGAGRLRAVRGVEALLPLVPGLADVLPDLAAPARSDPDTERYALFDAVVAALEITSAAAPVVLILDDLHWAAKPTLLLLRHLLRFGDHARVQIVGTYRNTDLDRSHPLAATLADLHRDGTADRLNLGGLDEDDVTAYVAEAGYDDEELAHALASVTGGNPFFLIEALRHVEESGGVWDQSTLPQGVREAVSRRLSRLPAETNKALAAAAVVGSRFALELVEQVTEQDLVDPFDEAAKAGILIEEPSGHYRFNHALVRQSLLAELPSVRRMRLHQRIATTLEALPGADEELLAELAYHYFECAWAGNAVKAVEYSRRAADQAMARLAYEGAADLYDRALHALEEIDDELPDRDDQVAELLVARCEALLAAGEVASAASAVSQLQAATTDSVRLAAWATCFDGQLSMLIHPERLDQAEAALAAAAARLAGLDDAAGEAKAHTVRAGCLARLGRVGDCEIALDDALTAARRAREHRRVNAVLANAPLAALWGPNPVPRAGGRCLDVVRLLRITTDSPAVEATSTRCQAVLEAFRGRTAAARRMIDSARRTLAELGLRHALMEVEQFAGIVELVADEPAAAEPHLRKAYNGFRRMGLDADTAETAALLGRTCLALDRDAEADELCTESERLAGHALKASIAWRTLRAKLLARQGDHAEARRIAEAAVSLAERTDALVDHGDACQALAMVLGSAGDVAGARAAAERAADLYERKGAAALAEKARGTAGEQQPTADWSRPQPLGGVPTNACVLAADELDAAHARQQQKTSAVRKLGNSASVIRIDELHQRASRLANTATELNARVIACINQRDWGTLASLLAEDHYSDDRRRFTGLGIRRGREADIQNLQAIADLGAHLTTEALAVRGNRLALTRTDVSFDDQEQQAFHVDALSVVETDLDGRGAVLIGFDVDDFDAAIEELDRRYLAGEAAAHASTWSAVVAAYAAINRHEVPPITIDFEDADHRRGAAFAPGNMVEYLRAGWKIEHNIRFYVEAVHAMSDSGTVVTHKGHGNSPEGFDAEWQEVMLFTLVGDSFDRCEVFDGSEVDAALARFDELRNPSRWLENAATRAADRLIAHFTAQDWDAIARTFAADFSSDDRRRVVGAGIRHGRDLEVADLRSIAGVGITNITSTVIAIRGERLVLTYGYLSSPNQEHEAFFTDTVTVIEIDSKEKIIGLVSFDADDVDAAFAELDARYLAGEAAPYARMWQSAVETLAEANRHEPGPMLRSLRYTDHRRVSFGPEDFGRAIEELWTLVPDARYRVPSVHALDSHATVSSVIIEGTDVHGNQLQWARTILQVLDEPRFEVFEEDDVDAALARFEELRPRTPRLANAASQTLDQFLAYFAVRGWDAMAELLAHDILSEDRRRVANAGVRRGRDAAMASWHATSEVWTGTLRSSLIAIRGQRLALCRFSFANHASLAEAFQAAAVAIIEVNGDNQVAAGMVFDPDDFESAFAELEARYLAGEGAAHARTWSGIVATHSAVNRNELPATTPDPVYIDHRPVVGVERADLATTIRALWDITPAFSIYPAAVHRLDELGTVATQVLTGTTREGLEAEWRMVGILIVEGDRLSRFEVYEEADLEAALAHFEELRAG